MQARAAIVQHHTSDASGIGSCSREFAAGLLASGAPCALIDEAGYVAEASAALESIVAANGRPASEVFLIDPSELVARPLAPRDLHGVYACSNGELVPLMLRPIYVVEGTGSALFLIIDGAPFRGAEIERFKLTPYAVIRLRTDGRMHYANEAAIALLETPSADRLEGRHLTALFDPRDAPKIGAQLANAVKGKSCRPLDVAIAARNGFPPERVRLILMPDPAPDTRRTLGVIAVVGSVAIEQARDRIRKIAIDSAIPHWEERLGKIVTVLKSVFSFEQATFGVYAENVSLFRALFLKPREMVIWPARWMQLPPSIRKDFLEPDRTWVEDIRELIRQVPEFADDEVVKKYLEHGIMSSVTLPIKGRDDWSCAFTLCSRTPQQYGKKDLERLRELDLESVLLRIDADIKAERESLWRVFKEEIASAEDLRIAGTNIVKMIASHFKWDHASLFRVNRHKKRFEMVYQVGSTPEHELKPSFHTQPIGEGMFAATLHQDRVLIIDDKDAQPGLHGYKAVNKRFRSAMTIPVHLNGRVRWIVNAESAVTHAFMGPDKTDIEKFVKVMEEGLERRMLKEIRVRLLDEMQQGVVMVGLEGTILEMNAVAARLLGRLGSGMDDHHREHRTLARYAADEISRERLSGLLATAGQRIQLKGDDGRVRAVLATRRELDGSFDTALWFLTDLETQEWNRELSFLREAAADVAQQARGPLVLASTLAQQLPMLWKGGRQTSGSAAPPLSGAVESLCQRVVAEVGKADIPFERLAEGLAIVKEPIRTPENVDLRRCVQEVVSFLPGRDRDRIVENLPEPLIVTGDAGRLSFVVRSLLAHLLRCLPDDSARVEIDAGCREDHASLTLRLKGEQSDRHEQRSEPHDAVWQAIRAARDDAGLGLTAVTRVIEAHGGTLSKEATSLPEADPTPPWIGFHIDLPRQAAERSVP